MFFLKLSLGECVYTPLPLNETDRELIEDGPSTYVDEGKIEEDTNQQSTTLKRSLHKADKVHKGGSFLLDNFVTLASTIGVTQSTGITTTNAQSNDNQESNQEKALLCTDKDLSWKERCILYDDVQIQDARAKIQPTMLDMKYNDVTPYNICKVLLAKDEVIDKKN